jgi:transcriptional regulator of heat shock response
MVRKVDYNSRKKDILRKTIELYLETAQPVGSEVLLQNYGFGLSPATVRNVLKDLEGEGYLTHPYTSSGRIPTDLGYKFYINDLMGIAELSFEEKDTLKGFFNSYLELKRDILENVSQILSDLTHYVGIVNQEDENRIYYCGWSHLLEQPEFQDIGAVGSIFKALEEDRLLELMNRKMQSPLEVLVGGECDCLGINNCSLVIRQCQSPKTKRTGRLAVLGPRRMAYKRVIPMMDYLSQLVISEL